GRSRQDVDRTSESEEKEVTARRMLSVVAGVSLVYDLGAGLLLLVATDSFAAWFGATVPHPVIFVKLNAIFLIAVGVGYLQPLFNPDAHRPYLWVFGVFLKSAGAFAFIVDVFFGGSPKSFLLFAVTDGALAVWTFIALQAKAAR
ncbi:MAG TPA: hypothetical protein VKE42_12385, partial [Candidatus Cybelea sp.]|nr:hypothetical protein [Candidatus Cybelea sp.]